MIAALALVLALSACDRTDGRRPLLRLADQEIEDASFEEGRRLLDQGFAAEAVSVFRTVLRRDGPAVPVLNGLAIAYAELGRPDLAADQFARALAIAPNDTATLNNIGFAALRRAEAGLARLYLERAERLGGDDAEIDGNLAQLARLEALSPGAISATTAISMVPAAATLFPVARKTESILRLGGLKSHGQAVSLIPVPEARPSRQAPVTLIDFTHVVDPWLTRQVEQTQRERPVEAMPAVLTSQLGAK